MNLFADVKASKALWMIVLASAVIVHLSYINNGFTWLEHGDIEQERAILPLTDLNKAFEQPFGETGFYRPLVTILHSLDAALYSDWAPGFHLTNVLLFVLTVMAVAVFASAFFGISQVDGLLAAFIFAIHPLTWLPVGSISHRPELLVVAFSCLAVFFYIRMRETVEMKFFLGFIVSFALALFSKETAVFWVPALLLAYELFGFDNKDSNQQSRNRATRRARINAAFGVVLLLSGYTALRMAAVPEIWHASALRLTPGQAFFTRLHALGVRLQEIFLPLVPSLSDATVIQSSLSFAGTLVLGAGLAGVVLAVRANRNTILIRVLIFLAIALAPALNLIALPRFSSPHYSFFATIAMGVIVARIINVSAKLPMLWQNVLRSGVVVWCAISAVMTFMHGGRFSDDRALFAAEVAADPRFLEGQAYLGDAYFQSGEMQRAATSYRAALYVSPNVIAYVDRSSVMINLAGVEMKQGHTLDAENLLIAVSGNVSESEQRLVDYNLALLANQRGDYARVVDLLQKHDADWQRAEPLMMLARALRYLERMPEALQTLERALPFLDAQQQAKARALIQNSQ